MLEAAEVDRLEMEISQFLSQSFLELDEGERQLMKRFGLTLTQYWALVHLNDEEGRSLSELANLLICDKSNMTSVVDKLEELGLATRLPGKAGDRRFTRVILTEEGHRMRTKTMRAQAYFLKIRFRHLGTENLQIFHQSLRELAGFLQAQFINDEVSPMIDSALGQLEQEKGEGDPIFFDIAELLDGPVRRSLSRSRSR